MRARFVSGCIAIGCAAWLGISPARGESLNQAPLADSAQAGDTDDFAAAAALPPDQFPAPAMATSPLLTGQNYFCPNWSARVGAILLQRWSPDPSKFIYNSNTNRSIVNASDFDFPFAAGIDVGATRYGDCADVDFRYFYVNQGTAAVGPVNAPAGTTLAATGVGASPVPLTINTTLSSTLQSAEINVRRNTPHNVTLLAGFRYVQLRDYLAIDANLGRQIGSTDINFGTRNNLYGFQIGADSVFWRVGDRFSLEGIFKAGVYGNVATNSIFVQNPGGGGSFGTGSRSTSTAFLADFNLVGAYQVTDHWSIRLGYQLLWLSGIATAPEQVHKANFSNGHFSVDSGGSALFNGLLTSVEYAW